METYIHTIIPVFTIVNCPDSHVWNKGTNASFSVNSSLELTMQRYAIILNICVFVQKKVKGMDELLTFTPERTIKCGGIVRVCQLVDGQVGQQFELKRISRPTRPLPSWKGWICSNRQRYSASVINIFYHLCNNNLHLPFINP